MSRVLDLLLAGIALLAWRLVAYDPKLAASPDGIEPINVTLAVRGDASLKDLGLLIRPEDSLDLPAGASDDIAPHQLAPWQASRTSQILVPLPGRYLVRWGAQVEPPPRRPMDVMIQLEKAAKFEDQVIEVTGLPGQPVIEIELPAVHADAIRAALLTK